MLSEPQITLIAQMGYDAPGPFFPFTLTLALSHRGRGDGAPTHPPRACPRSVVGHLGFAGSPPLSQDERGGSPSSFCDIGALGVVMWM